MSDLMRRIALFSTDYPTEEDCRLLDFCRILAYRGFILYAEASLSRRLLAIDGEAPIIPFEELPADIDLAVSIGGDGTFLRAARRAGERQIPIVGVNAGHLGFLTQYSLDEASLMADQILADELIPEPRLLLQVVSPSLPADLWPYALNDVSVLKEDTASMINIDVHDNDEFLADVLADGLIISTPTGSTGYALSAGGPILTPSVDALAIVPVAPHTLTLRPLLISASSTLSLYPSSRTGRCRVSLDGCSFPISTPAELIIRRASFSLILLRRPDEGFFSTLRRKLLWSRR